MLPSSKTIEKNTKEKKIEFHYIKFTCSMVCVEHSALCAVVENIKPFKSHV